MEQLSQKESVRFGEKLFNLRDYTPIPLIILLIIFAKPSAFSATLGVLVLVFGELVRIYSVAFIGTVSRTRSRSTGSDLISNGPFSIIRNPLYFGNYFIVLGLSIWSHSLWLILFNSVAFAIQYYFIIQFEESLLLNRFGPDYSEYRRTVPAFIPSRIPEWDEWEWPSSFTASLKSERRTFMAIIAILLVLLVKTAGA